MPQRTSFNKSFTRHQAWAKVIIRLRYQMRMLGISSNTLITPFLTSTLPLSPVRCELFTPHSRDFSFDHRYSSLDAAAPVITTSSSSMTTSSATTSSTISLSSSSSSSSSLSSPISVSILTPATTSSTFSYNSSSSSSSTLTYSSTSTTLSTSQLPIQQFSSQISPLVSTTPTPVSLSSSVATLTTGTPDIPNKPSSSSLPAGDNSSSGSSHK